MTTKNDPIKNVKASAFDWVFKGLIGIVLWLVADMHADLKGVLQIIPVMRNEIDHLKDRGLIDRFRLYQLPGKHEEQITYDSLIQK